MPSRGRFRAVGKCYYCQGPVEAHTARHVMDEIPVWYDHNGTQHAARMVRRLVHRGYCEAELRARLGATVKPKGAE